MNKIQKLICIFFSFFFIFCINTFADDYKEDGSIDDGADEQWRYEINNLKIEEDKITIVGWAALKGYLNKNGNLDYLVNNGKYTGTDIDNPTLDPYYNLEYQMRLSGSDGTTTKVYKYDVEEPSGFSVTCPLYYVVGESCFNAMERGGFDARNELDGIHFHDNTDFKFEIDTKDLTPGVTYTIEMVISNTDFTTGWKTIQVLAENIENSSNSSIKANGISTARMLAVNALKQNSGISAYEGGHSLGAYFEPNKIYNVIDRKSIDSEGREMIGTTGAKYTYYQLQNPDDPDDTAWAYSAWIEIDSDTSITTISTPDPCDDIKYAIENPGKCCESHPATCCGDIDYQNNNFDPSRWESYHCCDASDTFNVDYGNGNIYSFYTFQYYSKFNSNFNDLINNKCSVHKTTTPKACKNNTTKINNSVTYSVSYYKVNSENGKITGGTTSYDLTIKLDKKPNKNLTIDDIAYDYFSSDDYEKYIKQKNNSVISDKNLFVNKEWKIYALSKNDFTFNISNFKKISDTEYKITIKTAINDNNFIGKFITDNDIGESILGNNVGAYFVPIKIWLCDNVDGDTDDSDNCDDSSYFNEHIGYCCKLDKYSEDGRCSESSLELNFGDDYSTDWPDDVDCKEETSMFSTDSGKKKEKIISDASGTICTISCSDSIELSNYKTEGYMKNNPIKMNTGFEYNFNVQDNVTCEVVYKTRTYSDLDALNDAVDECNEALKEFDYDTNKINEKIIKNQQIKMKDETDNYEVSKDSDGNAIISKGTSKTTPKNKIMYYYKKITNSKGSYTVRKSTSLSYDKKLTYSFEYSIHLPEKYIKKEDQTITTSYTTSEKNKYVAGGEKHYIYKGHDYTSQSIATDNKTTTKTSGIYKFNVDFNNMGISKTNDTFTCDLITTDTENGVTTTYTKNTWCTNPPCIDPDNEKKYYYRPISLNNPFPNVRDIGTNWVGNIKDSNKTNSKVNEYITDNANEIYGQQPLYEITLDSNLIQIIQQYNKNQSKGYLDWENMSDGTYDQYNQTSTFLTDLINGTGIFNGSTNKLILKENLDREKKVGEF